MPSSDTPFQDFNSPAPSTEQSDYSWKPGVFDNFPEETVGHFMRYISQNEPDERLHGCAIHYKGYSDAPGDLRTVTILEHGEVITCRPSERSVTSIFGQNGRDSQSGIVWTVRFKEIEAYAAREGLKEYWRQNDDDV